MKVKDLIAELQKFDPELPVLLSGNAQGDDFFAPLKSAYETDFVEGYAGSIYEAEDSEYKDSPFKGVTFEWRDS